MSISVQSEFDDADVLGCFEEAYSFGGTANTNCSGISADANLYFRVGGIHPLHLLPFLCLHVS
jgi:hypothetical protein